MRLLFLTLVHLVIAASTVQAAQPGDACVVVDEDICSEDGKAILRCGDNMQYFQWATTTCEAVWGSGVMCAENVMLADYNAGTACGLPVGTEGCDESYAKEIWGYCQGGCCNAAVGAGGTCVAGVADFTGACTGEMVDPGPEPVADAPPEAAPGPEPQPEPAPESTEPPSDATQPDAGPSLDALPPADAGMDATDETQQDAGNDATTSPPNPQPPSDDGCASASDSPGSLPLALVLVVLGYVFTRPGRSSYRVV